jgi:hypothetical protein
MMICASKLRNVKFENSCLFLHGTEKVHYECRSLFHTERSTTMPCLSMQICVDVGTSDVSLCCGWLIRIMNLMIFGFSVGQFSHNLQEFHFLDEYSLTQYYTTFSMSLKCENIISSVSHST